MASANTEYSMEIPGNTIAFMFKLRSTDCKYCFEAGESGTNFITLFVGQNHYETQTVIGGDGRHIYFQSPSAGSVAEALFWKGASIG